MPVTTRITVPAFVERKRAGPPLAVLTCYDFLTARLFDAAGLDALLVGDSLGMVVQGRASTVSVTLDQMVYHTSLVSRAVERALVIADMPFLTYRADRGETIRNAGRLIQEGGAQAVKLEGGAKTEDAIRALVDADVPVMGHVIDAAINARGRYRVHRNERNPR